MTTLVFGEYGIDPEIEEELLSEKILSLSSDERAALTQFDDIFDVDTQYKFKDLAKNTDGGNDYYVCDKKTLLPIRERTNKGI